MTLDRRLAKLEASFGPTEAVLAWLAEAHEHPTLPDHVASLLDAPRNDWPLVRIGARVEAHTRASIKGKAEDVIWKAVRSRVADAYFLVELVIRINLAAEELVRFEGLRWALCSQWCRALSLEADLAESGKARPGAGGPGVEAFRSTLSASLIALYTEETARREIEASYLGGRSVLFPALAAEWADIRGRLEMLALVADKVEHLRGDENLALDDLRPCASEQARPRISELADLARAVTLDILGETDRAAAIIERQLRAVE